MLPTVAPGLVLSSRDKEPADPVRVYAGATGAGELPSIRFFSCDEGHLPTLLVAQADEKLQDLAATPNEIYICELFAEMATVSQLRDR